uniref:Tyrosine-protein kinase n=1 Tax=Panagrellus redivivus TaxID=6233 RepID=A0A7E4VAE8_PANRE
MADEHALPFFHGALLDEDADGFLTHEGDYLLQAKPDRRFGPPRLILAVRKGQRVRRIDMVKVDHNGYRFMGKTYTDLHQIINHYSAKPLELANGDTVILKRPIPKGKWSLIHKDIRLQKKIGSGAYGTVYKGIMVKDGRPIAVKRIDSDNKTDQALIDMMKEARVMQLYDHPNIVKFYGYIVDRTPYLLVMELCSDGAVEDKLRSVGRGISTNRRVDFSMQASRGLEYLHSKGCIHRDIATRNCLLHGTVLKLADFGMCRATTIYKIDLNKPQNVRWLAPEVWKSGETRFCTDVYAFAIMLWELFEIPYQTPYQQWPAYTVKERVMGGYRLPTPKDMPDAIIMLMKRCWDHDPSRRPTAPDVRRQLEIINQAYNEDDMRTGRMDVVEKENKSLVLTARSRSMMMAPTPTKSSGKGKDGNNNTAKGDKASMMRKIANFCLDLTHICEPLCNAVSAVPDAVLPPDSTRPSPKHVAKAVELSLTKEASSLHSLYLKTLFTSALLQNFFFSAVRVRETTEETSLPKKGGGAETMRKRSLGQKQSRWALISDFESVYGYCQWRGRAMAHVSENDAIRRQSKHKNDETTPVCGGIFFALLRWHYTRSRRRPLRKRLSRVLTYLQNDDDETEPTKTTATTTSSRKKSHAMPSVGVVVLASFFRLPPSSDSLLSACRCFRESTTDATPKSARQQSRGSRRHGTIRRRVRGAVVTTSSWVRDDAAGMDYERDPRAATTVATSSSTASASGRSTRRVARWPWWRAGLLVWHGASLVLACAAATATTTGVPSSKGAKMVRTAQHSSPTASNFDGFDGTTITATTTLRVNPLLRHRRFGNSDRQDPNQMCHVWTRHSPEDLCSRGRWSRLRHLRELSVFSKDCDANNIQLGELFRLDWPHIKSEEDLLSHTEHLKDGILGRDCLTTPAGSKDCRACFNRIDGAMREMDRAYDAFNDTLRRFDCMLAVDFSSATRPFSPNGTCDNCKMWYRKWLLVQLLDVWQEPPCINWCYYTQLACPHLAPAPHYSYAGHPSFVCRDLKIPSEASLKASSCNCFHPCDLERTRPEPPGWYEANKDRISRVHTYDFFASDDHCWARRRRCAFEHEVIASGVEGQHVPSTSTASNSITAGSSNASPSNSGSSNSASASLAGYVDEAPAELFNQLGAALFRETVAIATGDHRSSRSIDFAASSRSSSLSPSLSFILITNIAMFVVPWAFTPLVHHLIHAAPR